MAKEPPIETRPARVQLRYDATPRAVECLDFVKAKLHHVIERAGAANFIVEKVGAIETDLMEALLFKDGRDRELAMLQALRRKLSTYKDDTSAEAELGRAEAAIVNAQKAIAKRLGKKLED